MSLSKATFLQQQENKTKNDNSVLFSLKYLPLNVIPTVKSFVKLLKIANMENGADMLTMSSEIFENRRNF